MAEPIRKPIHRPRPPHPHVQKRPHTVLVRSRELPEEAAPETRQPQAAPARPALVAKQERPQPPVLAPPVTEDDASLFPVLRHPADREEERSARGWLRITLALHLVVLLTALFDQPASGLAPADLLLAGIVLLSGGTMLVVGGKKR